MMSAAAAAVDAAAGLLNGLLLRPSPLVAAFWTYHTRCVPRPIVTVALLVSAGSALLATVYVKLSLPVSPASGV
jgi:hypothetical protein